MARAVLAFWIILSPPALGSFTPADNTLGAPSCAGVGAGAGALSKEVSEVDLLLSVLGCPEGSGEELSEAFLPLSELEPSTMPMSLMNSYTRRAVLCSASGKTSGMTPGEYPPASSLPTSGLHMRSALGYSPLW